MKTLIIALTALAATAGAASAGDFGARVSGYVFVKADVDNDGVLNRAEQRRAQNYARAERLQK